MKILLVIRWPVGGIRTFIRYVYRHFNISSYEITILTPGLDEANALSDDLDEINVKYCKISPDPTAAEICLAIVRLAMTNKYDLIHSHGFTSSMCAALPAKIMRIPHILTSHDVLNSNQFKGGRGRFVKYGMGIMLWMVDGIHSVSYDAHNNLCEYYPFLKSNKKCVIIPNGIEVGRFADAEPINIRQKLALGDDTFLLAFFGRFMSQKGFAYLVEAVEQLVSDRTLSKKAVVIAFGETGYVRQERAKIRNKQLEGHFLFLPFASNVASWMKGVDVVVMPSLWESCGLVAMEAMVSGTPLIATSCIGLREVTLNTPAITVPVKDPDSIADAIKNEMHNSSKPKFDEFKSTAANRYDVQNQVNQLIALYETVTSQHKTK